MAGGEGGGPTLWACFSSLEPPLACQAPKPPTRAQTLPCDQVSARTEDRQQRQQQQQTHSFREEEESICLHPPSPALLLRAASFENGHSDKQPPMGNTGWRGWGGFCSPAPRPLCSGAEAAGEPPSPPPPMGLDPRKSWPAWSRAEPLECWSSAANPASVDAARWEIVLLRTEHIAEAAQHPPAQAARLRFRHLLLRASQGADPGAAGHAGASKQLTAPPARWLLSQPPPATPSLSGPDVQRPLQGASRQGTQPCCLLEGRELAPARHPSPPTEGALGAFGPGGSGFAQAGEPSGGGLG